MNQDRQCKQCSFLLSPKISAKDQAAIMHMFCSDVCRQLYDQEKQFVMDQAELIRKAGGL